MRCRCQPGRQPLASSHPKGWTVALKAWHCSPERRCRAGRDLVGFCRFACARIDAGTGGRLLIGQGLWQLRVSRIQLHRIQCRRGWLLVAVTQRHPLRLFLNNLELLRWAAGGLILTRLHCCGGGARFPELNQLLDPLASRETALVPFFLFLLERGDRCLLANPFGLRLLQRHRVWFSACCRRRAVLTGLRALRLDDLLLTTFEIFNQLAFLGPAELSADELLADFLDLRTLLGLC